MNYREAILNGAKAAGDLHQELGTKNVIEFNQRGNIDVFGTLLNRGAELLFRPLDGLLGACIDGPGVVISTNRSLPIQRFTGAHELGHVVMGHVISFDGEEILSESLSKDTDVKELEANAFAGEFLLPKWLLVHYARRHGWDRESMKDPAFVYQMSLRVGASYSATIWSLQRHGIVDASSRDKLLEIQPKTIKQALLPGHRLDHWRRDIWLITEKDEGGVFEGQPEDLFLFRLHEKAGAGYLWDLTTLKESGFAVVNDISGENATMDTVGSDVLRSISARSPVLQKGRLCFRQNRPWQLAGNPVSELQMQYDLRGKEVGMPRAKRPYLAAA